MVIRREAKEINIIKKCDVIVIGGGPAGIGAAVSAARQNKKVLLVEKNAFLGGNITACYVEDCNYFLRGRSYDKVGLYGEIAKKSYARYGNDNVRMGKSEFCEIYHELCHDVRNDCFRNHFHHDDRRLCV